MSFETTLKKTLSSFTVFSVSLLSLIGFTSTATAQDYYECSEDPYYVDPCCPDTYYYDVCNMNCTLYGDFIYWQTQTEGLEFARLGGFSDSSTSEVSDRGCILDPGCHYEPGFRVGLVYNLGCCDWDFFAQYTYLNPSFSNEKEDSAGTEGLRPLIWNEAYGGTTNINYAKGKWDSHFNVLDFGFGKTFDCNCCFDFRPHIGFKATWQELNYSVTYREIVSTSVTSQSVQKFQTQFDGIGLRGGFDAAWNFFSCMSIVGNVAISAVFSNLDTYREDTFTDDINSSSPTKTKNIDLQYEPCVLIPVVELNLGIWFEQMCYGCFNFYAFAGWENQIWFNTNRFIYVNDSDDSNSLDFGPNGAITYQGLVVRGGIRY